MAYHSRSNAKIQTTRTSTAPPHIPRLPPSRTRCREQRLGQTVVVVVSSPSYTPISNTITIDMRAEVYDGVLNWRCSCCSTSAMASLCHKSIVASIRCWCVGLKVEEDDQWVGDCVGVSVVVELVIVLVCRLLLSGVSLLRWWCVGCGCLCVLSEVSERME